MVSVRAMIVLLDIIAVCDMDEFGNKKKANKVSSICFFVNEKRFRMI